jgi:hypothetical protein
MSKVRLLLGCIWCSPLTAVGLLYVGTLQMMGWCSYLGPFGEALVWCLTDKAPGWVVHKLLRHGGQTAGNIVILRHGLGSVHGQTNLRHELEHVHQMLRLGLLYPYFYIIAWAALLATRNADNFYDHPLEIDCRRAAGQTVDVIGAVQKAIGQGKLLKKQNDV